MLDEEFLDDVHELWVDDLYEMGEVGLRKEVEQYARLARRYPHPTSRDNLAYLYAHIRHEEAMRILEARSGA